MKKAILKEILAYFFIVLMAAIQAAVYHVFIFRNDFAPAGVGGIVTRYTATASYTGTSSSRYATGYTVTADYTGEVAKPDCDVVTYTAIFGSTQASEGTAKSSVSLSAVKIPLLAGGAAIALTAGGVFVFQKIKKRR